MSNDSKRFESVYEQKSLGNLIRILRDSETGVCYLFYWEGSGSGLTPLLDSAGHAAVRTSGIPT